MQNDSPANSDETTQSDSLISSTRRRQFLKAAAVAGGVVGIGGLGTTVLAQDSGTTIELGGEVQGWQGRAPSSIEGQTNPTLEFTAGEEVTVTWENVDGLPHNFQTLDSDGNALTSTEIISTQGETQNATFTATTEMVEYNCQVHPTSMLGDVSVSEESTQTATQTATPTATETETATQAQTSMEIETAASTATETETATQNQTSTETATETETETTQTSTEQSGGNGKAKSGNGKAKAGNGKAKTGSGNQSN